MKRIVMMWLLLCAVVAQAKIENAEWIWYPEKVAANSFPGETRYFRTEVNVPVGQKVKQAQFKVTADNECKILVNGKQVAVKTSAWKQLQSFDLTKHLKAGNNSLSVVASNESVGSAGLIGELKITFSKGKPLVVRTSGDWQSSKSADKDWQKARVLGKHGMGPWGNVGSVTRSRKHVGVRNAGSRYPKGHLPDVSEHPINSEVADSLLEADWMFQADYNPTAERIQNEVTWARELAERISKMKKAPKLDKPLAELNKLEAKIEGCDDIKALYLAVRHVKRKIAFSNPKIDFDEILLVDSPYAQMLHGHNGHESGHRNGSQMCGGFESKLQVLKGLNPDGELTDLLPEGLETYVWRPDLSYDARKVVFCKMDADGPAFQLFEVNVDGSGLKQLTNSDFDDLDPIYLPDGKIAFTTTRAHTYVRCLPTSPSFVLARCDADGTNIRIISRNSEPDYLPSLLPNGSMVYTRWEYTERPLWRLQGLWTMNPDGTAVQVFWGNRSAYPDMLIEPRAIPDSSKVMFVGAGHHRFFAGCLGTVDISKGREYPDGLAKITADVRWPESGDGPGGYSIESDQYHASGRYAAYKSPYPIGEEDFVVSARSGSEGSGNIVRFSEQFSLYLMDIHGNRELIYRGDNNVWYAMPVKSRKKPAMRPDLVKWPKPGEKAEGGVLYSADVYEGIPEEDLPRGSAKYLRVLQMDAKTYTAMAKTWRHSGPTISIHQEDGVKRILGTVPIEADGSVHFKVPSGKALHFQLLDKDYRCLQIMRSFTGVMPGETRGCVGCHEARNNAPVAFNSRATAMKRKPSELIPPPWGANVSIGYERFAQPVLDKYCGSCHQGEKNPKARKRLDLTLRGGLSERGVPEALWPFKEPYVTLIGKAWSGPNVSGKPGAGLAGALMVEGTGGKQGHAELQPLKPGSMLSSTSPLIKMLMTGEHPVSKDSTVKHKKLKIAPEDLRRMIAWVDANCVYRGDEEVRQIPDPVGMERFAVKPRIMTAPVIDRLQPVTDVIEQ